MGQFVSKLFSRHLWLSSFIPRQQLQIMQWKKSIPRPFPTRHKLQNGQWYTVLEHNYDNENTSLNFWEFIINIERAAYSSEKKRLRERENPVLLKTLFKKQNKKWISLMKWNYVARVNKIDELKHSNWYNPMKEDSYKRQCTALHKDTRTKFSHQSNLE